MNTNYALNDLDEMMRVTDPFVDKLDPFLHIDNEESYQRALALIGSVMDRFDMEQDSRYDVLIDTISEGIRRYEDALPEVMAFDREAEKIPADIATLRVLMDQYGLGVKDLPEIGSKSSVSRILAGERNLTKQHIDKLSARFKISPALFF